MSYKVLPLSILAINIIAIVSSFVLDASGAYRFIAALNLVLFAFLSLRLSALQNKNNYSWVSLIFLFILIFGVLFGLVNVILRDNQFAEWIVYTAIYGTQFLALIVGIQAGRFVNENGKFNYLVSMLGLIAIAEMLWLIVRVLVVGLDIRTSYGFSFLSPFLLVLIWSLKLNLILRSALLVLMVGIIVSFGLLSGLRSVLTYSIILILLAFLTFKHYQKITLLIMVVVVVSITASLASLSDSGSIVVERFTKSATIVTERFRSTLFNEGGVRLDPNEGRAEEATLALAEFETNSVVFDKLFGRGFGFVFNDFSKEGEASAHIHVTPVAYYVRSGAIGLIFIVILSFVLLHAVIRNMTRNTHPSLWLLSTVTFLWFLSSFFAGTIISPIFWLALGVLSGITKNRTTNVIEYGEPKKTHG